MSIIYETLNRLEMESAGQAASFDKASVPSLAGKPKRLPIRVLTMTMVLALVGIGLALWHPNSRLSGLHQLPLANALSKAMASEKSDHELSTLSPGAKVSDPIQPAIPKNETVTTVGQSAASLVHSSIEETVEFDGQPAKADTPPIGPQPQEEILEVASSGPEKVEVPAAKINSAPTVPDKPSTQVRKVSLQKQPGEQTAAVSDAKISLVNVPSAKPKPKPKLAAPHKQQQKAQAASVGDAAAPNTADGVIEQAAYALSRGRYQQALVALEKLSPVPEHRADYWLIKGNAHLRIGQLDSAEKALASAQLLAPMNAQIAVQRAILKQEKGDHATALQILKDAGKRNPDVPEIFLNQGYSEQALGAVQDARHSFGMFLRITEGRSLYTGQRKLVNEWLAQFPSTSY